MTTMHYHITGPPTFGSEVPQRKEFNEFAKDADVVNLYLLALGCIQNTIQDELISYFQIAGIHGLPYVPWDNVKELSDSKFGGSCTHGSVIFPTWHRLYVALYEQVVWNEASRIANSYENPALKNKYQEAVRRLRQPYWDWAANTELHPLLNTAQTVTVVDAPKGETKRMKNPLLSYRFHPIDPSFTDLFSVWPQTLRYPTATNADAKSQPYLVQSAMDASADQLHDNIFNLLAFVNDWSTFSNHSTSPGNSLEAMHDQIHVLVGGNGHLEVIPMGGFDPIFFIHHTTLDRFVSLWQALNPTLWVVPGSSEAGSFTVPPGQTVDASSDLTPFHIDDVTFWNSSNSRDTKSLGYTYPEISDVNASPEELKKQVSKAVMELYGPRFDASGVTSTAKSLFATGPVQAKSTTASNPGPVQQVQEPSTVSEPQYPTHYYDWYVIVTVRPYEFSNSGYVHIFLTETIPSGNWLFAPERVGDLALFRNTGGKCANCNRKESRGETINGQVPLTTRLLKKGKDVNNVEEMEEYLKKNLQWRCALVDGTEVPLWKIPSLQIKLCSVLSERADGFPRRHEPEVHRSVTHCKVGGYEV